MKVPQLKSVLLELINEALFGHRFKISISGTIYQAVICKNVANDIRGESEYRMSWFESKTMEPKGHIDFGEQTLNYILQHKKFPMGISLKYFKMGLPTPKLIAEKVNHTPNMARGNLTAYTEY